MQKIEQQNHFPCINTVKLDETTIVKRHEDIEREKSQAIKDLLSFGRVRFIDKEDAIEPYDLTLGLRGHRFTMKFRSFNRVFEHELSFSLRPYKSIIKDYFLLCESYQKIYRQGDQSRLETVDMARRALHDEGAYILMERLRFDLRIDHLTARSLFTLICVLHLGIARLW